MDTFVWNDSYMTGEEPVDKEHQELVRIINWVVENQSLTTSRDKIDEVLTHLVDYAAHHFAHEEQLMAAAGCDPRFVEGHVRIHREFTRQIAKMREFPANQDDVEYLLRFLSSWLAHHILGIDQAMARQIRKIRQGVAPAQAFDEEKQRIRDPATASLLEAMNALFRLIATRNEALENVNASLEVQVADRTRVLSETNEQLVVEQGRLQLAMKQVEITQKKLQIGRAHV